MTEDVTVLAGFPEDQRERVVAMYWEAFSAKLHRVMGQGSRAQAFLRRVADPSHAISAINREGRVVGVAGFKTADGAFVGGELSDLTAVYGVFGGTWRGLVLSLLERRLQADTLLMDGIMVDANVRGQGVGTRLLAAVRARAKEVGCSAVRLDVIDSNPRARALYEREGFVPGAAQSTGLLRHVFGFRSATPMTYVLD